MNAFDFLKKNKDSSPDSTNKYGTNEESDHGSAKSKGFGFIKKKEITQFQENSS